VNQLQSGTTQSSTVTDGQKERVLLRERKNVGCRTLLCFVVTAFQIDTDRLGLYCNVNTQDMKLDRESVLC
jgi:hypothetical protein